MGSESYNRLLWCPLTDLSEYGLPFWDASRRLKALPSLVDNSCRFQDNVLAIVVVEVISDRISVQLPVQRNLADEASAI